MWGSKDTPVALTNFETSGSPFKVDLKDARPGNDTDKIIVFCNNENTSGEKLDALMIGFEFISVFKDYLDHVNGYSLTDIKPGKSIRSQWEYLIFEASLVGYVLAYPYKARFKNGQIWNANLTEVEKQLEQEFNIKVSIAEREREVQLRRQFR